MISTLVLLLGPFLLGYLLGSIPFGLLLTRAAGLGDIRKVGSGNIGATNVLRTGRKGLAAATLLLDALKGVAAGADRRPASASSPRVGAAAGAVLGHMFPVWLGFKGGKGMATTLGVMWGLCLAGRRDRLRGLAAVRRRSSATPRWRPCSASRVAAIAAWFLTDRAGGDAAHPAGAAGLGAPPPEHRAACSPAPSPRSASAARPQGSAHFRRVKPSGLQSSLPTPWWTKKSPSGSTLSLTCRSRG